MHVDQGRVENPEELAAESWQDRKCTSVEHEDKKGIVPCPSEIVNLQVSLAFAVEGRVVLGADELEELHDADELVLQVDEHDLAVDFVDTVHGDGHKATLVVRSRDQRLRLLLFRVTAVNLQIGVG